MSAQLPWPAPVLSSTVGPATGPDSSDHRGPPPLELRVREYGDRPAAHLVRPIHQRSFETRPVVGVVLVLSDGVDDKPPRMLVIHGRQFVRHLSAVHVHQHQKAVSYTHLRAH